MSTRANIIIRDEYSDLWFYRHSDGYPEGTMPTLEKFMGWVKDGRIRDNAGQASGWLIMIGAEEYGKSYQPNENDDMMGWKVGAYEPTFGLHGDVEYVYVVDLHNKEITIHDPSEFE